MWLRRRRLSLLELAAASRFQLFQLQPPRLELGLLGSDLLVEHLFRVLNQRENILRLHVSEVRHFHRFLTPGVNKRRRTVVRGASLGNGYFDSIHQNSRRMRL